MLGVQGYRHGSLTPPSGNLRCFAKSQLVKYEEAVSEDSRWEVQLKIQTKK